MRRSFTAIAMLVAMAILFTAAPTVARSNIALGVSDPKSQNMAAVETYKQRYGRYPAMWSLWSTWGARGSDKVCDTGESCAFPTDMVDQLMDKGITPVIWWQYADPQRPSAWLYSNQSLLKGKHNAYIRQWASEAGRVSRAHGTKSIIVRPFHEATGTWFPWSIGLKGNTMKNYKEAWRFLYRQVRAAGASRAQVKFLWSNYTPSKRAYPGDSFVEFVGFTVLNWGARKGKWRPMPPQVDFKVKQAAKFTKKPIIIAETASFHRGGNKAKWLKQGYLATYRRYPRVRGILYLDAATANDGKHPNWRLVLPRDGSAVNAYRWLSQKPGFQGGFR